MPSQRKAISVFTYGSIVYSNSPPPGAQSCVHLGASVIKEAEPEDSVLRCLFFTIEAMLLHVSLNLSLLRVTSVVLNNVLKYLEIHIRIV